VFHWGEDGIAGISDDKQRLCFSLALWNGKDPILKERIYGLTNRIPKEAAKICRTQHEHPAIAERYDVSLARPPAQQGHLAKKVAAPQPHVLVRQHHFDCTRGDQKHRVTAVALADDDLFGNQQPRPEQAGKRPHFSSAEAGEHLELSKQVLGVQPQIEWRQLIRQGADRLVLPLQIFEDFFPNQAFLKKIVKS
jgi:hypothetical protein